MALLAVVGIIWPLLALGAPGNSTQLSLIVPWGVILLILTGLIALRARASRDELMAYELSPRVDDEYQQHLLEIEAMRRNREQR